MKQEAKKGYNAAFRTPGGVVLAWLLLIPLFSCSPATREIPRSIATARQEIAGARAEIDRLYPEKTFVSPELELAEKHNARMEAAWDSQDELEAEDQARIVATEAQIAVRSAQSQHYKEKSRASEAEIATIMESQSYFLQKIKEMEETKARREAEAVAALKIAEAERLAREAEEAARLKIQEERERSAQWVYKIAKEMIPAGLIALEPHGIVIRLPGTSFRVGSAEIEENVYPQLDQIVQFLARYPQYLISVEGHTDSTGRPDKNMTLSRDRAQAVAQVLIKTGGYPSTRFTVNGYGDTKPLAENRTKAGRARNRRVEIVVHIES